MIVSISHDGKEVDILICFTLTLLIRATMDHLFHCTEPKVAVLWPCFEIGRYEFSTIGPR